MLYMREEVLSNVITDLLLELHELQSMNKNCTYSITAVTDFVGQAFTRMVQLGIDSLVFISHRHRSAVRGKGKNCGKSMEAMIEQEGDE